MLRVGLILSWVVGAVVGVFYGLRRHRRFWPTHQTRLNALTLKHPYLKNFAVVVSATAKVCYALGWMIVGLLAGQSVIISIVRFIGKVVWEDMPGIILSCMIYGVIGAFVGFDRYTKYWPGHKIRLEALIRMCPYYRRLWDFALAIARSCYILGWTVWGALIGVFIYACLIDFLGSVSRLFGN